MCAQTRLCQRNEHFANREVQAAAWCSSPVQIRSSCEQHRIKNSFVSTQASKQRKQVCVCASSHIWKLLLQENNGSSSSSKSRQDSMVRSKLGNQSVHGHVFLCSGREVVKSEMLNKHWNCFEDGLAQKKTERITATGHLIKELPVHKQGVVWFGQLTS